MNRILAELEEIKNNPPCNCSAGIQDNNYKIWEATIIGPSNSPYCNGIFKLIIKFPDEYPFKPPLIKFKTKILHPNINPSGNICLDILNTNWSPVLSISKVLLSISSLLNDPNPKDPLNKEIAKIYLEDKNLYEKRVKLFTLKYAI